MSVLEWHWLLLMEGWPVGVGVRPQPRPLASEGRLMLCSVEASETKQAPTLITLEACKVYG